MLSAGGQRLEETGWILHCLIPSHCHDTPIYLPHLSPHWLSATLSCPRACLLLCVCMHVCACACAPVCPYTCEPNCISTFTVMEWSEVDTGYRALRCENTLCGSSVFNRIPALCLEAWNTGNHSHRRDSGSFFIWAYISISSLLF